MITLILMAAIIGIIAGCFTGLRIVGIVAGVFIFICGLPFALITSLIFGGISYAEDRADMRQEMSELAAIEHADKHEHAEDARADRIVGAVKKTRGVTYNDNRQVHLHGGRP